MPVYCDFYRFDWMLNKTNHLARIQREHHDEPTNAEPSEEEEIVHEH